METLLAEGVEYIFGNPGTTELPLIDGLVDYPQISYILALHEAVAVSMADAYAHASGRVGVVNLHVGPGLGNGLGSVYNAWEGQTPMVVTAGQQDNRMRLREPLLSHDLVAMAEPLTKWSVEAQTADELPLVLNRAFKTARETPSGPVFVSLPMNVMEQTSTQGPMKPSHIYGRSAPDAAGVQAAAGLLAQSRRPAILCGDKVTASGAMGELIALAEQLGAAVHAEVLPAHMNFPTQHDQFRDRMARDHALIRERLREHDVILMVGGEFFEEVWFAAVSPFADDVRLIQVDPSAANVGRNLAVDCGLVADIRLTLLALHRAIDERAGDEFHAAAARRRATLKKRKAEDKKRQQERARKSSGNRPMSTARLMAELDACLPDNISIASEAITATADVWRTFSFHHPAEYLESRGGGIGQGLPSAIGVKLAYPERPVLCLSGDGSALYTIQALWTAVHHSIPVVFLILNNRTYRILKLNMNIYRDRSGLDKSRGYAHLDLAEPAMDFPAIAQGFGMQAARIEDPQDIAPAIRTAFESGQPWLLDVVVDGAIPS